MTDRPRSDTASVPAMGLDGLGSSANGPAAALTVRLPLGALGLAAIGPIVLLLVAPRLVLLQATYRRIPAPLPRFVERIHRREPERTIAVLVPTVAKTHLRQHLLHTHDTARLSRALMRFGGDSVVVVTIPWHFDAERLGAALIPEARHGAEASMAIR